MKAGSGIGIHVRKRQCRSRIVRGGDGGLRRLLLYRSDDDDVEEGRKGVGDVEEGYQRDEDDAWEGGRRDEVCGCEEAQRRCEWLIVW